MDLGFPIGGLEIGIVKRHLADIAGKDGGAGGSRVNGRAQEAAVE